MYRNIIAQHEAKVQELRKHVESLKRRVRVCMPADMNWNIIGSFY